MQPVYVGTAVFTLLEMAADRWLLFKSSRGIEAAVFLCMMKIYIFCIISGVSYSLDMPAISFYSFMIVMSILFIASPWKLYCAKQHGRNKIAGYGGVNRNQ